jgi:hypothetical protein
MKKVNGSGPTAQKSLPKDPTNGGTLTNPTTTTESKIVDPSCTTVICGTICPAKLKVLPSVNGRLNTLNPQMIQNLKQSKSLKLEGSLDLLTSNT